MKFWRMIKTLPQPVKAVLMLFTVFFAVNFFSFLVLALLRQEELLFLLIPWMFGGLGVVGFLLGLVLVTDFRGSAQAYAGTLKNYKPFGVDYSRSPFSKPGFLRFFGAGYMLVGVWFVVISTLFAFTPRGGR